MIRILDFYSILAIFGDNCLWFLDWFDSLFDFWLLLWLRFFLFLFTICLYIKFFVGVIDFFRRGLYWVTIFRNFGSGFFLSLFSWCWFYSCVRFFFGLGLFLSWLIDLFLGWLIDLFLGLFILFRLFLGFFLFSFFSCFFNITSTGGAIVISTFYWW